MLRAMIVRAASAVTAVWLANVAVAEVVDVPIDPDQSSVDVTVCVLTGCDADASPVGGTLRLDLDSISAPSSATLVDFSLDATEPIDIFISLGLGSTLTATATDVALFYATPGTPNGPVPIIGDDATFLNVPVQMAGSLDYTAAGLVCTLLQGSGYPCSDVVDLGAGGPTNADQMVITITSQDRVVTILSVVQVVVPLDPDNPGLGDVTVLATLRGSVFVPCPGDLNNDSAVDLDDLSQLLVHFGQSGALTYADGDIDGDDDVDLDDLSILLVNFGSVCS